MDSLPITESGGVAVFDCRVILSATDESGTIHGRCGNLAGPKASGTSERNVLRAIVDEFRDLVRRHHEAGETIPFVDPPETPGPGESERFVPIHL